MQDNAGQQYLPGFWCGVDSGVLHRGSTSFTARLRMSSDLRFVNPVG